MTEEKRVLVVYVRVSKADGSQTTDLQRDALLAAGIGTDSLYEDKASGKKDDISETAFSQSKCDRTKRQELT